MKNVTLQYTIDFVKTCNLQKIYILFLKWKYVLTQLQSNIMKIDRFIFCVCVTKNVKWWLKICISYLINNHITLNILKDGHHFGYKYNIQRNTLVGSKFKWWKPNTFGISLCTIIKSSQDQSKQKYVKPYSIVLSCM